MHETIDRLINKGLKYLTLWGFSTDNWKRSPDEVAGLFQFTEAWLARDTPWLHRRYVKVRHIGRLEELPQSLQLAIGNAVELTSVNTGMVLVWAFNYSGRAEILDAVRRLVDSGELDLPAMCQPELDEKLFSRYLYTEGIPDVDLVIRTAGEFRTSNFMLWQTAYSEYYFSPYYWPDFDEKELEKALAAYRQRDRRFGGG